MLEREKYHFFDTSSLVKTPGIEKRATEGYLRRELKKRFPEECFEEITVEKNASGKYQGKFSLLDKLWGTGAPIEGLPVYYETVIHHRTGANTQELIVWTPEAWNDRFAGTAGGGTGIGGRSYLTRPNNTQRGWTVPYAVMNGFSAATMDAKNVKGTKDFILDRETGMFSTELYENWRIKSTHDMTVFGKAVTEILHDRPVSYSYMSGGSGGGRQSLMEAENFPEDYDGVWAACPAINWHKFIVSGLWPEAVMNEKRHFLTAKKNQFFLEQVHKACGGKDTFYRRQERAEFDAASCVGMKSPGGRITAEDAAVMNEIWRGPHRRDGERLWYSHGPGIKNWQSVIPIGTYYYPLLAKRQVKPFILGIYYARWITGNPKQTFEDIDFEKFERLYDEGLKKFSDSLGDNPSLDAFAKRGGKLLMDHGTDDPLIPVEGTIDYYRKLLAHFGGRERLDQFCRLYITPGDNHGNCWGNGPGITESDGMRALMEWVEEKKAPEEIRTVQVRQKDGELIRESRQKPYRISGEEGCYGCS